MDGWSFRVGNFSGSNGRLHRLVLVLLSVMWLKFQHGLNIFRSKTSFSLCTLQIIRKQSWPPTKIEVASSHTRFFDLSFNEGSNKPCTHKKVNASVYFAVTLKSLLFKCLNLRYLSFEKSDSYILGFG